MANAFRNLVFHHLRSNMNGSSFVSIGTFSLRISTTRASKRLSASSAKRIGLNPAILREHDLAAGDLIRVTNASRDGDHQQKVFALVGDCFASNGQLQFIVGVAWPSSELPTQCQSLNKQLLSIIKRYSQMLQFLPPCSLRFQTCKPARLYQCRELIRLASVRLPSSL